MIQSEFGREVDRRESHLSLHLFISFSRHLLGELCPPLVVGIPVHAGVVSSVLHRGSVEGLTGIRARAGGGGVTVGAWWSVGPL